MSPDHRVAVEERPPSGGPRALATAFYVVVGAIVVGPGLVLTLMIGPVALLGAAVVLGIVVMSASFVHDTRNAVVWTLTGSGIGVLLALGFIFFIALAVGS